MEVKNQLVMPEAMLTDQNLSSAELEKKYLENAIKDHTNNPEDIAAAMFKQYEPRFVALLPQLSKKQMIRVILDIVRVPLMDPETKPHSLESEIVTLGQYLQQSVFMMIQHVAMQEEAARSGLQPIDESLIQTEFANPPTQTVEEVK